LFDTKESSGDSEFFNSDSWSPSFSFVTQKLQPEEHSGEKGKSLDNINVRRSRKKKRRAKTL
jgi:hypothetical protein